MTCSLQVIPSDLYIVCFDFRHLSTRGGWLGSRPKKMYGERLGDGVEYHLMSPTPRRSVPFTTGRKTHEISWKWYSTPAPHLSFQHDEHLQTAPGRYEVTGVTWLVQMWHGPSTHMCYALVCVTHSYVSESNMWVSHTCEQVTHMSKSHIWLSHTHKWVKHMSEWRIWIIRYDVREWVTHMSESHVWVSHTYEWVTHMSKSHIWVLHTYESHSMTYVSESHIWVSHTYEWVTHMSNSHIWISQYDVREWVTHEWDTRMSKSHIRVSHTYEWVTHMNLTVWCTWVSHTYE